MNQIPKNNRTPGRARKLFVRGVAACLMLVGVLYLAAPSISVRAFPLPLPFESASEASEEGVFPGYLPLVFRDFQLPSIYGVELSAIFSGELMEMVQDLGSRWMRVNALLWSSVEPVNNGGYNWGAVADLEVELAVTQQAGMQPILIVRSTPSWAQLVPGAACGPIKQVYFEAFGDFLVAAVERYSGPPYYVRHFEIWNEPDVDPTLVPGDQIYGCWGDKNDPLYGGEFYGEMLKVVYPMMKNANPDITVLVGGLLLDCDPRNPPPGKNCEPSNFLEGILTAGAKNAFDGVSFHAYDFYNDSFDTFGNPNWHSGKFNNEPNGSLRPVLIKKAEFINEVLAAFNATGKILMNTEAALLCGGNEDPPGQPPCEPGDDSPFEIMKASYVAQVFPAAAGEGLTANLWFTVLGWRNSGLINQDKTLRLGYHAFDVSEEILAPADFKGPVVGQAMITGYKFDLPNGHEVWVVWATNGGPKVITLPSVPLSILDATGDPVAVSGNTATLTEEPYYIELP